MKRKPFKDMVNIDEDFKKNPFEGKKETRQQRIEYISSIHKKNLNSIETKDEIFEAGILAGIKETEEILYSKEQVIEIISIFHQLKLNEFKNLLDLLKLK
jgi:hypothetical protein